jgi:nucleotide-binding universal stress UspA family protein
VAVDARELTWNRISIESGMAGRAGARSLVLAVDGSPHSRRAVALAARPAPPAGGRVTVVCVVEPVRQAVDSLLPVSIRGRLAGEVAELERARPEAGRRSAEAAVRTMRKGGWRAQASVRTGVPLAEILLAVREARADLLVLGGAWNGRPRPRAPRQRGLRGAPARHRARPRREGADPRAPFTPWACPVARGYDDGSDTGARARAPAPSDMPGWWSLTSVTGGVRRRRSCCPIRTRCHVGRRLPLRMIPSGLRR